MSVMVVCSLQLGWVMLLAGKLRSVESLSSARRWMLVSRGRSSRRVQLDVGCW